MKKLITALLLAIVLLTPGVVRAEHETDAENCVETQVYGGGVGVVCGVKTHDPVDTAIGDNPVLLAGGLLLASYGFLRLSKKAKAIA